MVNTYTGGPGLTGQKERNEASTQSMDGRRTGSPPAEFGMYHKSPEIASPEIAPLAQPANPLEATTGEATTGAGAPTGGAPPEPHRSQTQ